MDHKKHKERVYFIGIGGIGVSALARWYKSQGWVVSGSDIKSSIVTQELAKEGIVVFIGPHQASHVSEQASLVVYSADIIASNPERREARRLSIPQNSYAEALGAFTCKYKTIAIAGAHGKSTTTAMIALILIRAGFDPTVIVGTRIREFGNSNFRFGKSEWLVIEADEHHCSFFSYRPFAAIVTNLDHEHLDFYKSFANIKKAFSRFVSAIPREGYIVLNGDNTAARNLKKSVQGQVLLYDLASSRSKIIKKILKVPGAHNLSNALAADKLAEALGIPSATRLSVLGGFRGAWRRFEYRGLYRGARVYDDYAHHPTEIRATLAGARGIFGGKRIWCVFQPHHTERLRLLFREFMKAFSAADQVIILETYAVIGRSREKNDKNCNAKTLASRIGAYYCIGQDDVLRILEANTRRGDVIICMGAGDIGALAAKILRS